MVAEHQSHCAQPAAQGSSQAPGIPYHYNFAESSPAVSQSIAVATPLQSYNVTSPPLIDASRIREELSLSQRHSTPPQHLLCWPCSQVKLNESQLEYPVDLEIKLPRLSRSTAPPRCLGGAAHDGNSWVSRLSLSQLKHLTRSYFSHFHPSCLILEEGVFYNQHLNHAITSDFTEDIHTCVVLLVCSLGAIASHHTGQDDWSNGEGQEEDIGLGFFNLALNILRDVEMPDWLGVQCYLLSGYAGDFCQSVFPSSKITDPDIDFSILQNYEYTMPGARFITHALRFKY